MTSAAQTETQPAAQPVPALTRNLEVRNFRSAGLNTDGEAWSCTLYLDGRRIGTFFDGGDGSPAQIDIDDEALERDLNEWARGMYGFEFGENLALAVEHADLLRQLQATANKGAKKGYEVAVFYAAQPYRLGDEPVTGDYFRDNHADKGIMQVPRAADVQDALARRGAVHYIIARPTLPVVQVDDELDALKRMLAKYRRKDAGVTGVVLMRDGSAPDRVVTLNARRTLEIARNTFGFTQERVVMHGGRS